MPLVCVSCDSKIITRTQVGHRDMQKHSFPCPTCGVVITFILDLDQKNVGYKFRDPPDNATWAEDEEGAVKTLAFSDEIVLPASMPDFISPFIAIAHRYDSDKYREDEASRQRFVRQLFGYAERCRTHFERGNWALFDKESPSDHDPVTPKSRLTSLYLFYTAAFMKFTLPTDGDRARIRQRLIYAKSAEPARFDELANYYLNSGRIASLWREIFSVRTSFIACYPFIQPLVMVRYWKDAHKEPVTLTDKRFNELRQLYIDCFETLCRLLVLGMGYEMIIQNGKSEIPTKKGSMTLEEFERQPNAAKRDHIPKMAVGDLFLPLLDTDFRNGVGHHSAHYEQEPDAIVIFDSKDSGTVSRVMGYTEFCQKVLDLFAAFELAVRFHHDIHIHLDGRFN